MAKDHQFYASSRQYQEKLKHWGARKNITRRVRSEFDNNSKLNEDEIRRLSRQIKSNPRKRRELPQGLIENIGSVSALTESFELDSKLVGPIEFWAGEFSSDQSEGTSGSPEKYLFDMTRRLSTSNSSPIRSIMAPDIDLTATSYTPEAISMPDTSNEDWSELPDDENILLSVGAGTIQRRTHPVTYRPRELQDFSMSPASNALSPPFENAERLFQQVQIFCTQTRSASPFPRFNANEPGCTIMSPEVSTRISDLKDTIYLYKLGTNNEIQKADKEINTLCTLPFASVIDISVQFLVDLIATLAPLNMRGEVSFKARRRLLHHFYRLCREQLGREHAFSKICQYLWEESRYNEVSLKALRIIRDSLLGWSSFMVFKIELLLIATLRRQNQFAEAATRAQELIRSATVNSDFGLESVQVRKTQLELALVYLAQGDPMYDAARDICRAVASQNLDHSQPADAATVRAKENIGEIHRHRKEWAECITMLESAADDASRLWKKSVATSHIVDKLFDVLKQCGQFDRLETNKILLQAFL